MPPKKPPQKRPASASASASSPKRARNAISIAQKITVARRISVDKEDINKVWNDFKEETRIPVQKKQVQDWVRQYERGQYADLPNSANRITAGGRGKQPVFWEMEEALFEKMVSANKRGEHITRDWIEAMAKALLKHTNPNVDTKTWRLTNGYFHRLQKRQGISLRSFTKKKPQQKAKDPLKLAVNLLRYHRRRLLNAGGLFHPSKITAVDEVPNSGCALGSKTYAAKGAKEIPMASNAMQDFKYTALYPFFGDGIQHTKPVLIFEPDPEMTEVDMRAEMQQYHPDCIVYWQDNHFVDGENFENWLETHWKPACTAIPGNTGSNVCMFDAVAAHNTHSVKEWFRKTNHINTVIPASSTYFLQVGDIWPHAVIKLKVAAQEKAWLDQGHNRRDFYNGIHKPSDRRALLTQWQVAAFEDFHQNHQESLVRLFRRLGYTLDPRGSEDGELDIAGCSNIAEYLTVDKLGDVFEGLPGVEEDEEREKMWWDDIDFAGEEDVEEEGEIGSRDVNLNNSNIVWLIDDSDVEEIEDEVDVEPPVQSSKGKGKAVVIDDEDGTAGAPISLD
ncbi:hypothetical protein NHQ30_004427 [Ciborinia camelliae]|nr:hypothetical protein NHQ30_004427 [Ciborinia camelliae]